MHQDPINKEEQDGHRAHFHSTFADSCRDSHGSGKLAGSDLAPSDFAALEARWIDRDLALAAQLRRVDSPTGAELVGRKSGNYAGIAIPYFLPGSNGVREYRLRRDHPEMEIDSRGQVKPKQKYLSPPGRGNMLHFSPGTTDAQLRDATLPLIITEGEFKTLALWRLANWNMERPRFLPVGVSGVYNWRGTVGKTTGPDGSRLDVKGPIADLERIAWKGRKVVIAYDADSNQKDLVRFARAELARHLRGCGAVVGFLEWDFTQGKGIDDHLALVGPEKVLDQLLHVTFTGLRWQDELLRSKVSSDKNENSILPVLANAITALRLAPEWQGVLAYDDFAAMLWRGNLLRGEPFRTMAGPTRRTGSLPSGCNVSASWYP